MKLLGRVQNGVVVLEGAKSLPEGAEVTINYPATSTAVKPHHRTEFPLVRTGKPGTVHLTGERIAEILDAEDAFAGH